jgi:chemotaxis protein CheD
MKPSETGLNITFLKPGELFITRQPALVMTVLGSCVSVTMFSKRLGLGAICHAQLPESGLKDRCSANCPIGRNMSSQQNEAFKYVDCSICYMAQVFASKGIRPDEREVKLFGGAEVLAVRRSTNRTMTVGRQNIEMALNIIDSEKMNLTASSVGGRRGRKLVFYAHSGEVLQKYLKGISREGSDNRSN